MTHVTIPIFWLTIAKSRKPAGLGRTNESESIIIILLQSYPNPLPSNTLRPFHYIVIPAPCPLHFFRKPLPVLNLGRNSRAGFDVSPYETSTYAISHDLRKEEAAPHF